MNVSLDIGHTPNYATVRIGAIALHFSYSTIVGFTGPTDSAVRQNVWGPTTGKHLNRLDGGGTHAKEQRVTGEEFHKRLDAQMRLAFPEGS